MKYILTILLTFRICFPAGQASATAGVADNYYVDCSSASNGNGSQSSPYNNLGSAFSSVDGGASPSSPDYIYVKGECRPCGNGDCSNNYQSPTLSFGSKKFITLATWPGNGRAYINGGTSPTGTVLGTRTWAASYITLDDLEINGHMSWGGVDHLTIKNSLIHGGGHLDHINLADPADSELMIVEDCQNFLLQNNKLYDNNGESTTRTTMVTYFGKATGDTDMNAIVEFNEFYDSPGAPRNSNGIFLKDNADHITIRNNYFHDLVGYAVWGANQDGPGIGTKIHNNIFERCGNSGEAYSAVAQWIEVSGWEIHNNTFVENRYADFHNLWANTDWKFFNNILSNSNSTFIKTGYGSPNGGQIAASCDYIGHNAYNGSAGWDDAGAARSTFAAWQSYVGGIGIGGAEAGSISSAVNLSNLAENNTPDDFRLTQSSPTAVKSGGRSGGYPAYMGAWDPNRAMWIGYCGNGIGACDTSGLVGGSVAVGNRGDLNADGKVDVTDLGILLGNWGATSKPASDINQDGKVDVTDLGILLGNWN